MTADALRFLTTAYDLDRAASRVAVRDGEPVGLVNLGLRGPDALDRRARRRRPPSGAAGSAAC